LQDKLAVQDKRATRCEADLQAKQGEADEMAMQLTEAQAAGTDRATHFEADLQAKGKELEVTTNQLADAQAMIASLQDKLTAQEERAARCEIDLRAKKGEFETTVSQLTEARATIGGLKGELAAQEKRAADCEQALQAKDGELAALAAKLSSAESSPETPIEAVQVDAGVRTQALALDAVEAVAAAPIPVEPDDLRKIEGIGPKISSILSESGVLTYAQLADTPVSELRVILEGAGPRFRIADPTSWPAQARLAAEEKWEELKELQDRLSGGRDTRGIGLLQ
jgi:predicted flap endonuclease-1-like 5' DNA nuclease